MESESNSPPSVVKCRKCGCSCSPLVSSSTGGAWLRSVKRKHDEFEKGNRFFVPGFEIFNVARVQIETECAALRETVSSQQQSIQNLQLELEEERNASSSAANEAMSMILRLQREKAEVQMEARQYKRFAEEKSAHDQQEISSMEDLLYKREQAIQSLTCEVQAYKHRMLSYGLGESEVDGEGSGLSHNQSMHDNFDAQDELPIYDYPPLRCNPGTNFEGENEVIDIEKYAFGETPRDHLKNLEYRISQMERSPKKNQLDGDFSSGKNILEKAIVGQSPRWARLSGRISTDSMIVKEIASDIAAECPMRCNSVKKVDYFPYPEDYNPRKLDHVSECDDDMTNDRIYTIDSIHTGINYNGMKEPKSGVGMCEDYYMNTPKDFFNRIDVSDPADIKKLYVRLQALEADRESMRQAILSMRTDKAQLALLREIAQQLSKDVTPENRMPVKRSPVIKTFSIFSVFKWFASFVFRRKKGGRRSKYFFELSAQNLGLLMLLDNSPEMRQWRCLASTQV